MKTDTKESFEPSEYLEKVLEEAEKDIKAGRNLSPMFFSTEKCDEYLAKL